MIGSPSILVAMRSSLMALSRVIPKSSGISLAMRLDALKSRPTMRAMSLVAALASGEIAGAGLDVFEHEPMVHPGLLATL